jgi:hypothetical protein
VKSKFEHNLAEPIALSYHDALIFCRDNVCADCHKTLFVYGLKESVKLDLYNIYCYKCKRKIYEGETISRSKMDEIERNKRIGEREMSDEQKKKYSTEQSIEDLGF